MKTVFIALRSAVFGASFVLLWGWVAWSLHLRYDTALGFALPGWTRALGIALFAAGGALALACTTTFVTRGEGTPAPFDPPSQVRCRRPLQIRAQSHVHRWLHSALRLRPLRTLARDSALRTALAPARSPLRHPLRRAASPRHLWRTL